MIKSLEIKNFRLFKELNITGFKPINVIVGDNAAGKTAFLEAILVASMATPSVLNINLIRGIRYFALPYDEEQFQKQFSSLFFNFDVEKTISFKIIQQGNKEASLEIYFDRSQNKIIEMPVDQPLIPQPQGFSRPFIPSVTPLAFHRKSFEGEENTLYISMTQNGFSIDGGKNFLEAEMFSAPPLESYFQKVTSWYSKLSEDGKEQTIDNIMKKLYPDIVKLSIIIPSLYAPATLYASVVNHDKKIPLSIVSSGIYKVLSLILTVKTLKSSIILIDEIDNGIYYEKFSLLWKLLHDLSIENNNQIFLSTHSREFLKSNTLLKDNFKKDFSLIQLSHKNGIGKAYISESRDIFKAIESGIEVR
jgi:AAA15 family ATPase/GTPase